MANWNGLQMTTKGIALQAKVEAGEPLVITKIKLGSGVLPEHTNIKDLTDLVEPKQNLGVTSKETTAEYCKVKAVLSNSGLPTGYYVRELGVFAKDPQEGDILYMYTTDGAPDYLPAGGGNTAISQEFCVNIAISDTDNIRVDIDSDGLVTVGDVKTLIHQYAKVFEAGEDISAKSGIKIEVE